MAKSRRTIKTVDDAQRALVDLTPDGLTVALDYHYSWSREDGHTFIVTEFRAHVYRSARHSDLREFGTIKAHSPVELVRKFIETILPLIAPKPPAPPRRGIPGKTVPRLTYQPVGDLFQ